MSQACYLETPEDSCEGEVAKRTCGHYACNLHSDVLDSHQESYADCCEECAARMFSTHH